LIVQRVLTCRNVTEGRKALLLSGVVILPLFLLFLIVGALLWVYYQHHGFAIPLPETKAGFGKNDYVFPIFILSTTPPVVKGFLIVAILAAAMSSVSAALSALASVSTMDLFKAIARRVRSDAEYLRLSKFSTIAWAVIIGVVAFASQGVEFILNWAFSLNGLTSGAMLGGVLLAIFAKRTHPTAVVAAMLCSLVGMIALSQFSWTTEVNGESVTHKVFWPWFTLIGTLLTLGVAGLLHQVVPRRAS
jgi:Na+/proline symporter